MGYQFSPTRRVPSRRGVARVLTCKAGHTPCRKIVSRSEPYVLTETRPLSGSVLLLTVPYCFLLLLLLLLQVYGKFSVQFLHLKPKLRNSQNKCAHISDARAQFSGGGCGVFSSGGCRFRSESTATRLMCAIGPQPSQPSRAPTPYDVITTPTPYHHAINMHPN